MFFTFEYTYAIRYISHTNSNSSCFLHKDGQTSIGSACYLNFDPTETQNYYTDGIILHIVGDIRNKVM